MKKYRPAFNKYWKIAQIGIILFCLMIYLVDVIIGDGDGVVEQLGLNPLTFFIYGQLFLLLLWGITRPQKWISRLCLSISIVIVGLIGINFLMGKLSAFNTFSTQSMIPLKGGYPFTSYDTIYFKNFKPNTHFLHKLNDHDGGQKINIYINKDGMRGPELSKKKHGEHRILLLGDSFMQALQVDEEHIISHYLSNLLPDSTSVIQHGFGSWSPLLEFNWLLRKGMSFEPDEVILFLFNNDFFSGHYAGDQLYTTYANFNEQNHPTSFSFEQNPAPKRNAVNHFMNGFLGIKLVKFLSYSRRIWLSNNNLLATEVEEKLHYSAAQFEHDFAQQDFKQDPLLSYHWDLVSVFRDTSIWSPTTRKRVDMSLGYIESMNDYLQERGIAFSIQLIPLAFQFENENKISNSGNYFTGQLLPNTGLNQKLDAFCQQQQIPFSNLYDHFNSYKKGFPDDLLYFNVDGHWNERGHQVAAEAVAEQWYLEHK